MSSDTSTDLLALAEQVQERLAEPLPDVSELLKTLAVLQPGLEQRGWSMDDTQRLALATHLAAAVKRFGTGEQVAEIDPVFFEEVSDEAMTLAAELLAPIQKTPEIQIEEKFLVAVHLDAAQIR
ncbi:MAG: PRD domain-containing protein [Arachnia sp.]